jgi:DNA-binding MarR family transcriptional regulator
MRGSSQNELGPGPEEAGIGGLDAILGFHIRLAHGAVYRHFTETFADLELTQKQVSVLWLLDDHPGLTQTDVGQRLQMDRASVMAIVNRLQARAFVKRGRSAEDGRRQTLHLTPAGHDMLLRARAAVLAHEQWLKERFSQREVDLLIGLLKRIHG